MDHSHILSFAYTLSLSLSQFLVQFLVCFRDFCPYVAFLANPKISNACRSTIVPAHAVICFYCFPKPIKFSRSLWTENIFAFFFLPNILLFKWLPHNIGTFKETKDWWKYWKSGGGPRATPNESARILMRYRKNGHSFNCSLGSMPEMKTKTADSNWNWLDVTEEKTERAYPFNTTVITSHWTST